MAQRFGWGHVNINVQNLEASIEFYRKLGFETFIDGIPYLHLTAAKPVSIQAGSAMALAIPEGTGARACIMQLDDGFPKIDLTEITGLEQRAPLENKDRGLVRICLMSQDLAKDYEELSAAGIPFLSPPQRCQDRMADIATCVDPDGTLIELLQVYLDKWPPIPGG